MLKFLAVSAVIFAIALASVPAEGQKAHVATNPSQGPREKTDSKNNPASPTFAKAVPQNVVGVNLKSDPDQEHSKSARQNVAVVSLPSKDKFDWIAYWGNLVLVVVGIAGVASAVATLCFIRVQAMEMRRQRVLLARTLITIRRQANHMETQAGLMGSQIAEAKAQVALLAEQNKNARDRERARLVIRLVTNPEIGKPEHILNGGCPLRVRFPVENIGKSKALNTRASGVVDIIPDPEKGSCEEGFFQALPQIVDDGIEKHWLNLAGFGPEFDDLGSSADFMSIPEEIVAQIREGKKAFIQASGLLVYEDIFGAPHQTPFRFVWKSRGDDDGGMWLTRSTWVDYSPAST